MASKLVKVRHDLLYFPVPGDESRQYVKDPIRHQFYKYNELQIEMMKALDGTRTIEEVSEYLNAQFDADVPPAAIDRFIVRLEKALLLDVSSYSVDDVETRKQILTYLKKRNLALRVKARNGASEEGKQFEAATREINEGDPCKAAVHLRAVLDINPKNERARQVLLATHEAFFKTKTESVSHAKMVHAFNPDRMLGWIDKKIGRLIFSPFGVVLLTALTLSGIPAAMDVLAEPALFEGFGLFDFAIGIIFGEIMAFYHELCHGFACKHYGGTVDDVGWMMIYGVMPANYCDTSDTYLFPDKRSKIIVQLAGVFGTLAFTAVCFHLLAMTDPSVPIWTGVAWMLLVGMVSSTNNLIPLVKFDAYYALTDYLGIANLRERSFQYMREGLQRALLGVPSDTPEPTPRERNYFLLYAPLATIYTVIYIYGIYISFLLPAAVRYLGVFGVAMAAFYFAKLVVKQILGNLIKFGIFVARHRRQVFTPRRSLAFALTFGLLTAALMAPWPLYVHGTMLVEPQERAVLRAAEAGILAEVRVRENDHVKAGQIVAMVRGDELVRDRAIAAQELEIAETRLAMLERGARPEAVRLATARAQSSQVRSHAASAQLRDVRTARDLGATTELSVDGARTFASTVSGQARVSAAQADVDVARARTEELAEARAAITLHQERVKELDVRIARLAIRSPIDGVVVTHRPHEQVAKRVELGQELLEVQDQRGWRIRVEPAWGEALSGIEVGHRIVVAATGDPHNRTAARIAEIMPPPDRDSTVVYYSEPIAHASWRSGMTGQARIYGPKRSVAYRLIALPISRLIDFELPKL